MTRGSKWEKAAGSRPRDERRQRYAVNGSRTRTDPLSRPRTPSTHAMYSFSRVETLSWRVLGHHRACAYIRISRSRLKQRVRALPSVYDGHLGFTKCRIERPRISISRRRCLFKVNGRRSSVVAFEKRKPEIKGIRKKHAWKRML